MTNKEKYKKAFSTLHASDNISLEVEAMEKKKRIYRMKKAAAACAAAAVVCGSMTVAYAADLGGIRQKITAWYHGEQTQMHVTDDGKGHYTYTFTDENGEVQERGGGGVEFDEFGNEKPLSADEVLSEAGNCVETDEDGRVWLYYYDKKFEITELLDEDGKCKAAFEHDGKTIYFNIEGNVEGAVKGSYGYECGTLAPEDADSYIWLE